MPGLEGLRRLTRQAPGATEAGSGSAGAHLDNLTVIHAAPFGRGTGVRALEQFEDTLAGLRG